MLSVEASLHMQPDAVRRVDRLPVVGEVREFLGQRERTHIVLVCDGNRTWGNGQFPKVSSRGSYIVGAKRVEESAQFASALGVTHLSAWLASPDNLAKRPGDEMVGLVDVLQKNFAQSAVPAMIDSGVKFQLVGRRNLSNEAGKNLGAWGVVTFNRLVDGLEKLQEKSASNTGMTFSMLVNYGGDEEANDIFVNAAKSGNTIANLTDFKSRLALPDVDLLIRTSGKEHTNGIFPLQMKYGKIHVVPQFWPEFTGEDLVGAVWDYMGRAHTNGG